MNVSERILCAAIWYKDLELKKDIPIKFYLPINIEKGVVFCGHRHVQCLYTKHVITGLRDAESGEHEQGFLTSLNRFVDRREAFNIAYKKSFSENCTAPQMLDKKTNDWGSVQTRRLFLMCRQRAKYLTKRQNVT